MKQQNKQTYSTVELAAIKGVGTRTMFRYIRLLKEGSRFKKKSLGRYYSRPEAQTIARALDFEL